MSFMKKQHPFLQVDYLSTVNLQPSLDRKISQWLNTASFVLEYLFKQKIVPVKTGQIHVSLLICGDLRIRKLNREFRNKDKVTDVLSFPANDNLRKNSLNQEHLFLGDLAICHPKTIKQAKQFQISYMDEFIHLFFHGVIHLLGYDHELSAQEEKLMEKWEQLALKKFSELNKKRKGRN